MALRQSLMFTARFSQKHLEFLLCHSSKPTTISAIQTIPRMPASLSRFANLGVSAVLARP